MKTIATVTFNPAVDITTHTKRVVPERKLRCEEPKRDPGGGGINVSRAIKRLGGESATIYLSGGPTGEILERALEAEGLRRIPVSTREWTRENIHVFEDATDQEYRFGMPGGRAEEHEWRRCLEELRNLEPAPELIVASGSLPPGIPTDVHAEIARIARETNARFIADTSGEALQKVVREGVFLIKPNLREFQDLIGRPLEDEIEQEAAARELLSSSGCEAIVLSLGSAGAWLITKNESVHIRSPSVPIRSRVGAGDSMVGGMVLAIARGLDLEEAVRFGVAAGAAAVMTAGTELCRKGNTERIYTQMKGSADS